MIKIQVVSEAVFLAVLGLPGLVSAQSVSTPSGMTERENVRGSRFCEILVVKREGLTAKAAVYNTLGLNDCPEAQWKALNPDQLKRQNEADSIVMNGPRYFVMDRNALKNPGPVCDFAGMKARLVAHIEISSRSANRQPYREITVERESQYAYAAGKSVYELASPRGERYIMQSYSAEVDPHMDETALTSLASRLSLPTGWQYRVRTLTEDLIIRNSGSKAHVVQDDFKNTYQKLP